MKRVFLFVASLWLGIMGASAQDDRCDVNGDGEVNIADVTYVLDHILGKGHASVPTEEAGEAIDLGLPSGTKWANYNVGATKPEEYGGYYAWGETEEKDAYFYENYIHCDGSYKTCHDLGSDISGTVHDVAHVKWGGKWCMPTLDDIEELLCNCASEWTTLNGVKGTKFISWINGNSIFLPAAGLRSDENFILTGTYGDYWSSTQNPNRLHGAFSLYFHFGWESADWYDEARSVGLSVRPVIRN